MNPPLPLARHTKTLLVILCEAALEKALVRDARAAGAQGWTVTDVRGGGSEGVRDGIWEADRNIEMKIICEAAVAETIAEQVMAQYVPHYALALYFSEVEVLRPDRF